MKPWWEAFPGRAEHEYDRLGAAGIRFEVVDAAAERTVLQLRVTAIGDDAVDLVATYPDLYPFFPPAVRVASGGRMPHHLHPFSGDLCLLGRSTAAWSPGDDLAWLLTEQLPKALLAGRGPAAGGPSPAEVAEVEERQGEPFSEYYSCFAEDAAVLVDGAWSLPPDATQGALDVRVMRWLPGMQNSLLAAVFAVRDDRGRALAELTGHRAERFPQGLPGRWVRLREPVRRDDPEAVWDAARAASPDVAAASWQRLPSLGDAQVQVVGAVFPEERGHRTGGDGWVFVVRVRSKAPQPARSGKKSTRRPPPGPVPTETHLVRAGYAGASDMSGRVPELTGLAGKTVAILGLGALGGAVAEHLARAGVGRLDLVDRDRVEAGNLVRHVADVPLIGWGKSRAVTEIVLNASPGAEVSSLSASVGGVRPGPPPTEQDGLVELIDAADLVIDCTAEKGVQQAMAWLCEMRATDLVVASATNGGWGGRVARFRHRPGDGCWSCLELAIGEDASPFAPPAAPDDPVQPAGCADPTFTGSGFDLAEVSLQTVRVAVGVLQRDAEGGYPEAEHDVHVLALRDRDGRPVPPAWTGHRLPVHPGCTGHPGSR